MGLDCLGLPELGFEIPRSVAMGSLVGLPLHKGLFAGIFGLWIGLFSTIAFAQEPVDFVLVTHVDTVHELGEFKDVKRVLSGQVSRWADGTPVHLVLPPRDTPEMEWLCGEILGMSEATYRRYLLEKAFRGAIPRPIERDTAQEVVAEVQKKSGRLAPLPAALADEGVQVLELDE